MRILGCQYASMILALDYTYGIKRHKGFCIRFSQSLLLRKFPNDDSRHESSVCQKFELNAQILDQGFFDFGTRCCD